MEINRRFLSVLKLQFAFGMSGLLLLYFTETTLKTEGLPVLSAVAAGMIIGASLFALVLCITRSKTAIGASLREDVTRIYSAVRSWSLPAILCLSIAVGVAEEILFRGFIQGSLAENAHYTVGIGVSAILFGLMHFGSVTTFIFTSLYGLLFGIAYYFTESITLVIAWHITYDLLALYLIVRVPECFCLDSPPSAAA